MVGKSIKSITNWKSSHANMKRMYYHPEDTAFPLDLITNIENELDDMYLICRSKLAADNWYEVICNKRTKAHYTMRTITDYRTKYHHNVREINYISPY